MHPAPFGSPDPEATREASKRRSAPLAFGLGVVWLVVALSGLIQFASQHLSGNSYYVLMAVFLPYFVTLRLPQIVWLVSRPQFWLWLMTAVGPAVLYMLGSTDAWAYTNLMIRIVFFSFVAGSALVLVAPDAKRILRTAALIVLAGSIPLFFVELIAGSIFSVTEGRAAGLYGNANDAGAALLLCLLFTVDLTRPTTRGLFLAAVTTAAVFATFSRSAMVFAIALFGVYVLAPGAGTRGRGGERIVALTLIAIVAVAAIAWLSQNIELSDEAAMRLRSIFTGNVSDASAAGRFAKAQYAIQVFREHFWGAGLGFADRRGLEPHNTFLYLAIDYGILGLFFYVTLLLAALGAALRAGWRRGANAIMIALLVIWSSLFTHYVAGTHFFAVAFAALITGTLVAPRQEGAPAAT